ncbi:T9SS C-terminal target domain-containing protein [Paludibacter sp. 221]|uniref:T9SS type A sorting domain-containing protein n=1 Tax=Paludibacter sp. 221 TaxID=2302939 RepID=UPI0013CF4CFA|nr:T9SS type A sorting domain-containing protein [Paludibacter sp. 221]NDV46148.1 T9SS C-terminal target domain-containing protein [Paludibacter sp. 221]
MKRNFTYLLTLAFIGLFFAGTAKAVDFRKIESELLFYTTTANIAEASAWVENKGVVAKTGQDVSDLNPATDKAYGSTTKLDMVAVKKVSDRSAWFYITGVETVNAYYKMGSTTSRTLSMEFYDEKGADILKSATTPDLTAANKGALLTASGLDASKKYILKISATNDVMLYAVKFLPPTASPDPSIASFTVAGVEATIDNEAETITAEVPNGTGLASLAPVIVLGGSATSCNPASGAAQDFTSSVATPVQYTVSDGTNTKTYSVTITEEVSLSSDASLEELLLDGALIDGFDATQLNYDVVVEYGAAIPTVSATKNHAAATIEGITQVTELPGKATVTVKAQNGDIQVYEINMTRAEAPKEVTQIVFSNSFDAFIVEEAVTAYYLEGTTAPALESYKASEGAKVAIDGDKVIVTGADNSTRELTLTLEAVSPYTSTGAVTFDGTETWIKSGYGFDAEKKWRFAKAVEEASNKRISEGKTRIYFFVGACEQLSFTSSLQSRAIKVFVNGTELSTPTETGAANAKFNVLVQKDTPSIVAIVSNQDKGDGGVSAVEITARPGGGTGLSANETESIQYINGIIYNPENIALKVYTAQGKLVAEGNNDIDMNGFGAGMYIVNSGKNSLKIIK